MRLSSRVGRAPSFRRQQLLNNIVQTGEEVSFSQFLHVVSYSLSTSWTAICSELASRMLCCIGQTGSYTAAECIGEAIAVQACGFRKTSLSKFVSLGAPQRTVQFVT